MGGQVVGWVGGWVRKRVTRAALRDRRRSRHDPVCTCPHLPFILTSPTLSHLLGRKTPRHVDGKAALDEVLGLVRHLAPPLRIELEVTLADLGVPGRAWEGGGGGGGGETVYGGRDFGRASPLAAAAGSRPTTLGSRGLCFARRRWARGPALRPTTLGSQGPRFARRRCARRARTCAGSLTPPRTALPCCCPSAAGRGDSRRGSRR